MSWRADILDGPIPAFAFLGLDEDGQPQFGDPLPIYNINIAAQAYDPETMAAYKIEPTNPKRVFAGDDPQDRETTVCLSFADEAQAKTVLAAYWQDP